MDHLQYLLAEIELSLKHIKPKEQKDFDKTLKGVKEALKTKNFDVLVTGIDRLTTFVDTHKTFFNYNELMQIGVLKSYSESVKKELLNRQLRKAA